MPTMAEALSFLRTNATGISAGVGAGLQVVGGIMQAVEARRLGRYNARVAQANAQQEALNAFNDALQHERLAAMLGDELAYIDQVTAFQQARLDTALRRQEGEITTRIAASGLGFSGSPIAVLEEQARQGQIQKLALDFQANLQRRAVREEQTQQQYAATLARFGAGERLRLGGQQAGLARFEGVSRSNAAILGTIGAAGTGVQTVNYLRERQAGIG